MPSFLSSSHFNVIFVEHELLIFTVLQAFKKVLISIQLWGPGEAALWHSDVFESTI